MSDIVAGPVAERTRMWRPAALPGVEVLHATDTRRLWRWYHDTVTLRLVTRGEPGSGFDVRYRRWRYEAGPGRVALVEPGEVHADVACRGPVDFGALLIEPASLHAAAEELGLRTPRFPDPTADDPELAGVLLRLHALLASPAAPALEAQALYASAVRRLLTAHARDGAREPADRERTAVRLAREFIHAHVGETLSLDDVSRAAYLSKFHLARVFQREVGLPPHAYLVQLRLALARRRIRGGESITQAAYALGFADQAHLTRLFRQTYNVTPARYLREAA